MKNKIEVSYMARFYPHFDVDVDDLLDFLGTNPPLSQLEACLYDEAVAHFQANADVYIKNAPEVLERYKEHLMESEYDYARED